MQERRHAARDHQLALTRAEDAAYAMLRKHKLPALHEEQRIFYPVTIGWECNA